MGAGRSRLAGSVVLCGLSLSLGWGIRGNFGHAYGAMIPGALAALAAVVVSGREDWWRRAGYFALFGALGWSFGGTISYMQVIAYTHSGHWPSQLYGFACLCVIGFLWGALGGAGTALPACLDRERLTSLFAPTLAVFAAWFVQDLVVPRVVVTEPVKHPAALAAETWSLLAQAPRAQPLGAGPAAYLLAAAELPTPTVMLSPSQARHHNPLYWYDSSWLDALVALAAVALLAAVRGRVCWGTRLVLYLAGGWLLGFLAMVWLVDRGINFRMTPPRGDNWAGSLGMTAGAFVFLLRNGLASVARTALVAGLFGGAGFAAATFLKLAEVKYVPLALGGMFGKGTWETNWHSILEQTYGLFNGIGIGIAMYALGDQAPPIGKEPRVRRWTEVVAVGFVLLLVTYVNLVKNVSNWIDHKAIPERLYGIPSGVWFDAAYAALAIAVLGLLAYHLRQPLAVVPTHPLGQVQLLYLVLLWWVVVGNLMHAVPPFGAQRLVTEGVIHLNAVCCTVLVLVWPARLPQRIPEGKPVTGRSLVDLVGIGLLALLAVTAVAFLGTRAIHGNRFAGYAGKQTRFGPDALPPRPQMGQPHP
jgi:hypothetical protein